MEQAFANLYPLALKGENMIGSQKYKAECHWLIKDLVMIGEYPTSKEYLDHLIQDIKISTFICMVDLKEETKMYELDNYKTEWIAKDKEYSTMIDIFESPIRDFSISKNETMINFLDQIVKYMMSNINNKDKYKKKKVYYMHCMTGHGRTGLISALLLMCLYKINWIQALDVMNERIS